MNPYAYLVGLLLAVGTGSLAHAVLSLAAGFTLRLGGSTHRGKLGVLFAGRLRNQSGPGQNGTGINRLPWTGLYIGSALLGLLLLVILGSQVHGARPAFLSLPGLVWLARRYLAGQSRRFQAAHIRQFLIDLRLHLSLQGSLLLGLESMGRTNSGNSALYDSLRRRLRGRSARSGVELLSQVAEDAALPFFSRAVQAIQSAQQSGGTSDVDQAAAALIEELNETIAFQTEEEMQRLPLRITLLAMPFLLGPIIILLFYPLVDRILSTLSGMPVGGGF